MGKQKKGDKDGRHARSDRTEKSLTNAATGQFAKKGYDGASVRDIAEEAGVNPALVSYHFGGKEGLFEEVLDATMVQLGQSLRDAFLSDPDVVVGTRRALLIYLEYLRTSSQFPRVVARSMLDGDERILLVARSYLRPLVQIVKMRLGERPLPEHEVTTLFSASLLPVLYGPILAEVWGWEEGGPSIAERRHEHLLELMEILFARYASKHPA
jgi:TetR/AcrR family transcriptional regulator